MTLVSAEAVGESPRPTQMGGPRVLGSNMAHTRAQFDMLSRMRSASQLRSVCRWLSVLALVVAPGCSERVLTVPGWDASSAPVDSDQGDDTPDGSKPDASPDQSLFWASGIVEDIPFDELHGWRLCYQDHYYDDGERVRDILDECDGERLLIACGDRDRDELKLAAMAARSDVLYDCDDDEDCFHEANGVGWYFSSWWSWGFLPPDRRVERNSCDTEDRDGDRRLCWHTDSGRMSDGYRCGDQDDDYDDYDRYVFSAD